LEAAKIATAEVEKWLQENLMYPMVVCFVSYDKNTDRVYRGAKANS
jgi:O-acetyl-ADP-ribose deacetylase (regulator of RNase III)